MKAIFYILVISVLFLISGCSSSPVYIADAQPLEQGRLAPPNTTVNIPHISACTDSGNSEVKINADHPVTVLVHGCNGSAGRFRSLAQLYAFHGQQAVCFSYDDRDSLVDVSNQLISALDSLGSQTRNKTINVIGHSMGGLVARKAMESDKQEKWTQDDLNINLVTVSAPLSGIKAANPCGNRWLQWLSLGMVPASCWVVTGDNWFEITSYSDFIRQPGPLLPSIQRYLKVVTDERDTCRYKKADGTCMADDYVFSMSEQNHPLIDQYENLTNVEVKAGHVEIVGHESVAPRKLLSILQEQGMLAPTPPERKAALENLFAELY